MWRNSLTPDWQSLEITPGFYSHLTLIFPYPCIYQEGVRYGRQASHMAGKRDYLKGHTDKIWHLFVTFHKGKQIKTSCKIWRMRMSYQGAEFSPLLHTLGQEGCSTWPPQEEQLHILGERRWSHDRQCCGPLSSPRSRSSPGSDIGELSTQVSHSVSDSSRNTLWPPSLSSFLLNVIFN